MLQLTIRAEGGCIILFLESRLVRICYQTGSAGGGYVGPVLPTAMLAGGGCITLLLEGRLVRICYQTGSAGGGYVGL